jgi:hypothetical protein
MDAVEFFCNVVAKNFRVAIHKGKRINWNADKSMAIIMKKSK